MIHDDVVECPASSCSRKFFLSFSNLSTERERERGGNEIGLPVHVVLQLDLYRTIPRGLILVVVLILRYLCENREERNDRDNLLRCRSGKFLVGDGALLFFP